MKKWVACMVLGLAACDVPQAPLVTGPDGQQRIQINSAGLTCYDTRCLDIDSAARSVRAIGFETTLIPSGISVANGTISPDDFKRLGIVASLAGGEGSQSDRG
ncbi:MAG: hypothetical protein AAGB28_05105 [Pseudomonadota bacterium]